MQKHLKVVVMLNNAQVCALETLKGTDPYELDFANLENSQILSPV